MSNLDLESKPTSGGIGILPCIGIVFVILKLAGLVMWSWWFVLMPFIIQFVLIFMFIIIGLILAKSTKYDI